MNIVHINKNSNMKTKFKKAHMSTAFIYAGLSHCLKRKVGCVVVKNDTVIAFGYCGTPSGEDNKCEDDNGITLPSVVHAEENAIRKLERDHQTAEGAAIFITKIPCINCATRIVDAGITEVYYNEWSNSNSIEGMLHLANHGIYTEHIDVDNESIRLITKDLNDL